MQALAVTAVLLLALSSASAQAQVAAPPEGSEYKVVTIKSPIDGKPVHLLVCNNRTTACNYKWEQLCEVGKAQNTDPMGGIGGSPAFMRDKDGAPMRMFVCKE